MSALASPATRRRVDPALLLLVSVPVLAAIAFPLQISSWFGLPAHAFFVHVPVVLLPLAGLGALALVARPAWRERWGLPLSLLAVGVMVATLLAAGAGEALVAERGGGDGGDHGDAARLLRGAAILFALATTAFVYVSRRSLRPPLVLGLGVVVALLAVGTIYQVIHTGHLGAEMTWGEGGGPGGPGGPPPGP